MNTRRAEASASWQAANHSRRPSTRRAARMKSKGKFALTLIVPVIAMLFGLSAFAQSHAAPAVHSGGGGGEADLMVPDLGMATFMGQNGRLLLMAGIVISLLGMV